MDDDVDGRLDHGYERPDNSVPNCFLGGKEVVVDAQVGEDNQGMGKEVLAYCERVYSWKVNNHGVPGSGEGDCWYSENGKGEGS